MSAQISAEIARAVPESVASAIRALELGPSDTIGLAEIGVVLEEALSLDVARVLGPLPQLRERLVLADAALRSAIISRIDATLQSLNAQFVRTLNALPQVSVDEGLLLTLLAQHVHGTLSLRARIGQRAFERVISERVAPPLRNRWHSAISRAQLGEELPGIATHAVVVVELIGAVDEIFPLILDAYSHDLRSRGAVTVNVIGVHQSWLNESGKATRAIYYNHATKILWENDFEEPLPFQSCQFLCLGLDEARLHAELAAKLSNCVQINSLKVSERCDDKYRTATMLNHAGVQTPKAALLEPGRSLLEIGERLAQAGLDGCRSVIIQPNKGTEGIGAASLNVDAGDVESLASLEVHVQSLIQQGFGDILVRERVDCVRWHIGPAKHVTSLRVNVCWDGSEGHAESAYLQVAGSPNFDISSANRGGFIVSLSEGAFEQLQLSAGEIALVSEAAVKAIAAMMVSFNDLGQLGLFGVDCLLERRDEMSIAWVLEINARPAGLSYSDLLQTREPGVTTHLFGALTKKITASGQQYLAQVAQDGSST